VALLVLDDDLGAGHVGAQPGTVRGRDEHVPAPVADLHRHGDRIEVESPRPGEGEVVVDPPPHTTADEVLGGLADHPGELSGQHRTVTVVQRPVVAEDLRRVPRDPVAHLGQLTLELRPQPLLAVDGPAELRHVERVHAGEEVEVCEPVGRDTDVTAGADDAVGQQRGHSQAVRSAAGRAADSELRDAEVVDDRAHVADAVRHGTSGLP